MPLSLIYQTNDMVQQNLFFMGKSVSKQRVSRVILAVLNSPNKSAQRAALWAKLVKLRSELN